jgi:hypothetical protein
MLGSFVRLALKKSLGFVLHCRNAELYDCYGRHLDGLSKILAFFFSGFWVEEVVMKRKSNAAGDIWRRRRMERRSKANLREQH